MSRLVDTLKAQKNDPRPPAEITYDLGRQLEASGNQEVFDANPDFKAEYLSIKSSLRRPVGGEMWDAFATGFKDTLPEQGYNALGAAYQGLKAITPGVGSGQDSLSSWLAQKAEENRQDALTDRGEVSVGGLNDINNISDLARFGAVGAAEAIPQLAPMAAAALAPEGAIAGKLAQLGLGARGAELGAAGIRALAPVAVQNTGTIYGQLPDAAKNTGIGAFASMAGGVASGAVDVLGEFAGPLGRFLTKASPVEKGLIESMLQRFGASGVSDAITNVLQRGGFRGAAANAVKGGVIGLPQMLAHEAITIASEEYGSGQAMPADVISSRLKNAALSGGLIGAELGGLMGIRGKGEPTRAELAAQERNTVFDQGVSEPAGPLDFGEEWRGTPAADMSEPSGPLDFGQGNEIPTSPEEQQAMAGVQEPAGPMEFQTPDSIDEESLAHQVAQRPLGPGSIMGPSKEMASELGIEADSYVQPKKTMAGETPTVEGPQSPLPDKFDITKPLLGLGNEIYAADAPDALSPLRGLEDAQRFGIIRSPEEVAADLRDPYAESKISRQNQTYRKGLVESAEQPASGFKTSSGSEYSVNADETTTRTKRAAGPGSGEGEKSSKTVYVDSESGGPVWEAYTSAIADGETARIATRGDSVIAIKVAGDKWVQIGEAEAKISRRPSKGLRPLEIWSDGAHLGHEITDITKSAEQVREAPAKPAAKEPEVAESVIPLADTISPDKRLEGGGPLMGKIFTPEDGGNDFKIKAAARGATVEGQAGTRKAVALLDRATGQVIVRDVKPGETRVAGGKRESDIIVGTMQRAPAGTQRERIIDPAYGTESAPWRKISAEMYRGAPRFDVMGWFGYDDPRSSVHFNFKSVDDFNAHEQLAQAVRNTETRGIGQSADVQKRIAKFFPEHTKLTEAEMAKYKKELTPKQYAEVVAFNKSQNKRRTRMVEAGSSPLEQAGQEVLGAPSSGIEQRAEEGLNPAEEAELADVVPGPAGMVESGQPLATNPKYRTDLNKIAQLVKRGATDKEITAAAEAFLTKFAIREQKTDPAAAEAVAKRAAPALVAQLKAGGGRGLAFTMRSSSSWLMEPGQARNAMMQFLGAAKAAGADIMGIQTDLDSAYDAIAKSYAFTIPEGEKGRAIVGIVADWVGSQPNADRVYQAAHEVAHVFMDKAGIVDEETRRAFQSSFYEMGWQHQNYLVGPATTDLRIIANTRPEFLTPEQHEIFKNASIDDIQRATAIAPDELLTERAVDHLALLGIDRGQAKGIFQQVIRFVKDLALQVALAFQRRLKGDQATDPRLVRAFVENRWLQFINQDFAASKSSIHVALRDWIGAPTVVDDRIPVYRNFNGDPDNFYYDPKTGLADPSQFVSSDSTAVVDRVKMALDRYNAETTGRPPNYVALEPLMKEHDDLVDKADAMEGQARQQSISGPGEFSSADYVAIKRRIAQLDAALDILRDDSSDAVGAARAIRNGEKVQFSQRRPQESLNPEIEANTQLASINFEDEVYAGLHAHPDVKRFLPPGTTYEEFLSNFLQLSDDRNPTKKREALVLEMTNAVDPITNSKFPYDPKSKIGTLPSSIEGSSPQQTAIRDTLIKLNQVRDRVQSRLDSSRERRADLNTRKTPTTAERNELDKLNSRIPMLERVMILKDAGLDDQIARQEGKIGAAFLWDASPNAEFLVPPTHDADEQAVRGSTGKIPNNLAFDSASAQTFRENLRKQTEWLSNPDNKQYGALYGQIEIQNRKLMAVSSEPVYTAQTFRLRNTYFDSLRNMLRGIGTPIAKYMGGRFDALDSTILRWGNTFQIGGNKWSRSYDEFKRAVGWKGSDEDFSRRYWNRIVSYIEDTPDGTVDPAGKVIDALRTINGITLPAEAQSHLRTMLRETYAQNSNEAELQRSSGIKVEDPKLGKDAQRDIVRQGYITGRRTISEQLDRIYQDMRTVWSDTSGNPLFNDIEAKYNADPDALKVNATRYFTPVVVNNFVKPFIYHNRQYFKSLDAGGGAGIRMANLSNVRDAFERSGGDMVEFAKSLNQLEGGSKGGEARFVAQTLGVFNDYYHKFADISNERAGAHQSGVETLPRQIMDARKADDIPPEFIKYAKYDAGSNRTLLFQLALNSAFGRNGLSTGEFAKNLNATIEELKALHIQLSDLIINQAKSRDEAKKIMGPDKYEIALQASDHLKLLNRFTDKMAMVTKSSGALMADIRMLDELVGLNANMNLQSPRSALVNTLDMLAPFYRLKLSSQAFASLKNGLESFGKDMFGSLFESLNIHAFTQSETNLRMQKLGLHDAELYLSWKDKLADYGPGNALSAQEGVESTGHKIRRNSLLLARRAKNITNLGVADIADLATLRKFGLSDREAARGDEKIAPKLRVLGIFNTVGHGLANASIDGQYNNFKDLISRGMDYIKSSANPDDVAGKLLDGKITLTAEDLGYTRKWMILNDKAAFDYMRNAISEKLDEATLERMVGDAYTRMKADPKAEVITDKQFVRIANLALTEFQLNANFSNAPIDLKTNSLWRLMSPYLTWPYLAMLRVPDMFKDANGRWKMKAAVDGMAVSVFGIAPLTMAASLMFDWFDENILGKRSNLREAKAKDIIPGYGLVDAPMATLERAARYGAGGLLSEAANSLVNPDSQRGGLTPDSRILFFSQLQNFKDIVGNLWHEGPGNMNYSSVMRPFAQFIGLSGVLQYQQIANKQFGLSNEEAAVNSRVNISNYLRAAGRDLDLNVRINRGGPGMSPNEVTPYVQNMELAAYLDDMNMFRNSYRLAVSHYHELFPDEPDAAKQVVKEFAGRHPLKRVFAVVPTEGQYRSILGDLNPNGQEAVTSGIHLFNRYMMVLGAKPIEAKDDSMSAVQDIRRRILGSEAIREAQAMAAQAAYHGAF